MTQRQDCPRRGGAVDEEKVVVRKGNLTLASTSGKIERSADAFPVRHHRTSWVKKQSRIRKPTGDRGTKNEGSGVDVARSSACQRVHGARHGRPNAPQPFASAWARMRADRLINGLLVRQSRMKKGKKEL